MKNDDIQNVFLIGAKSLGAYGGYETFVNKLTEYHQNTKNLKYHVACKANGIGCMDETKMQDTRIMSNNEFIYHNARCFKINIPNIGPAQAIYYDLVALRKSCEYIKKHNIQTPIVYIMACRIGPFAKKYYNKINKLGGKVFINPDGHEWMRQKWSKPIRKYWKLSEKLMVKYSDLVICDSKNIEKYIHKCYDGNVEDAKIPKTVFIAYGAEMRKSKLTDDDKKILKWYDENALEKKQYYLIVGRFVPENNYEIMIREFMASNSSKKLAIITNENKALYEKLENKLHFSKDNRIRFVGTIYDSELLMKIRENAYGYIHGHEVGGTNPSLLEALGSTELNLLLDVGFNKEVAENAALYWSKSDNSLSNLIDKVDVFTEEEILQLGQKAKQRIRDEYNWTLITDKYRKVFQIR